MKLLKDLFPNQDMIPIKNIKTDSREVEPGDIFVATHGFNVNHTDFIDDAVKNGAAAIVTDEEHFNSIPCIKVENIENSLIEICQNVYDYKNDLDLIGITGTDGKTTTSSILYQLLNHFFSTAYIGTNGIQYKNKSTPTNNTTPKKEELYYYFSNLKKQKCQKVVMEVSSEALLHNRVNSFLFSYVIFTNITEDHLNIHKTLDSYINSKLKLIDYLKDSGVVIINKDDKICSNIKVKNNRVYTYGKDKTCDFQIKNIRLHNSSATFIIKHKDRQYKIKSPYPFEYNIYNLTAAFIVCYLEKFKIRKICKYIKKLKPISGRCEYLDFSQNYKLILDYAHTENGIKNIVENVKKFNQKIIVVTGSAGGREREKRKYIGKYLLDNTDLVIFTMDDPRYENVDCIIDDMISMSDKTNYKRIISRPAAIKYALDSAEKNDIVLILGKGRDNYMAIGDEKIPYNDYEEIETYFTNLR